MLSSRKPRRNMGQSTIEGEHISTHSTDSRSTSKHSQRSTVFGRWVQDRILLVWAFILSFVVLDTFFTYLGLQHLGMEEKNIFVSLILSLNNGWVIWLIFKVLIAVVGTALFFLVYYWVSTSSMSAKDRDGVLLIEFCGWIYLLSFNLFSIISWSGTFVAQMN